MAGDQPTNDVQQMGNHGKDLSADVLISRGLELEKLGFSQPEVASILGVNKSHYWRIRYVWLAHKTAPSEEYAAVAQSLIEEYDRNGRASLAYRRMKDYQKSQILTTDESESPGFVTAGEQRRAINEASLVLAGVCYGLSRIKDINEKISAEEAREWVAKLSDHRRTLESTIKKLRRHSGKTV